MSYVLYGSAICWVGSRYCNLRFNSGSSPQAGFTLEESPALDSALRKLVRDYEAVFDRADEYGTYYRVTGNLEGLNGLRLAVVTIWIERTVNNSFQFVTLFPSKDKS
ncbi:DUF6883 domain-containing protein [Sodalinema gerasimenkoae]|uniref:DUF6883 domain-containing protein n=1 Tax=Sodalinema gerasimenkoae TaxID=2862348 RepID=UPI003CCD4B7E